MNDDTKRIEFLESRGCVEIHLNNVGQRMWWAIAQEPDILGVGATLREAIDISIINVRDNKL